MTSSYEIISALTKGSEYNGWAVQETFHHSSFAFKKNDIAAALLTIEEYDLSKLVLVYQQESNTPIFINPFKRNSINAELYDYILDKLKTTSPINSTCWKKLSLAAEIMNYVNGEATTFDAPLRKTSNEMLSKEEEKQKRQQQAVVDWLIKKISDNTKIESYFIPGEYTPRFFSAPVAYNCCPTSRLGEIIANLVNKLEENFIKNYRETASVQQNRYVY